MGSTRRSFGGTFTAALVASAALAAVAAGVAGAATPGTPAAPAVAAAPTPKAAHAAPAPPPAAAVEHQTYGRFGQVSIYRHGSQPAGIVVLVSDDEGWDGRADEMARDLESVNTLVIGLDLPYYERRSERLTQDCSYPAGDFEMLSKLVQKKLDLPTYTPPIVAGIGSGATLAYGALAQAPSGTFAGAISLGFCPRLEEAHPLCTGRGLVSKALPGGESFRLEPIASVDQPWLLVPPLPAPGETAQCGDPTTPEAFAAKVKGAVVIAPPKKNGKKEAAADLRAGSGLKQAFLRAVNTTDLSVPPATPVRRKVADLPILELPVPGTTGDTLAVVVSGDGGWTGLDRDVASELATQGFPVVGINSLQYFWTPRTPESAAADLARILRAYMPAWNRKDFMLVGYSLGAEVLPFMAARLPADLQSKLKLVAMIGPTRTTSFKFELSEWLGHGGGENRPVLPEVIKLKGKAAVACIFGASEKATSLCPILGNAGTPIALKGAHYLGNNPQAVTYQIVHAMPAAAPPPPPPAKPDEGTTKKPQHPAAPPPGSAPAPATGNGSGSGSGSGSQAPTVTIGSAPANRIALLAGFGAGLGAGFASPGPAPGGKAVPAAAPSPGPAPGGAEETTQYGRFGTLHLVRQHPHPGQVVLLFSGEQGWDATAAAMAQGFAARDFLAVGIDTAHYLGKVAAQHDSCAYTAGSLENLSKVVQKRLAFPRYVHPVVAGFGGGAALAYGALAQAPPNTFQGGIGLDFCPLLPAGQTLCPGHGLAERKTAKGAFELLPGKGLLQPWIALQPAATNPSCPAATGTAIAALATAAPGGAALTLAAADRTLSQPAQWLGDLRQAIDRLLTRAALPTATAGVHEVAGSPALPDLPVIEMTGDTAAGKGADPAGAGSGNATGGGASGGGASAKPLVVVLSGDGGWTGVDREVGKILAGRDGMPVVGLDSLSYFWNGRTPAAAAADLARVLRHYLAAWKRDQVVLVGYSLGADVLPFLTSRLPADLLAKVRLVALLGPSHTTPFDIRVKDDKATELPVLPEIAKLSGRPLLCLGGEGEADSLCPEIAQRGLGQAVELRGSHAFDGDYATLASHIARAVHAPPHAGRTGA